MMLVHGDSTVASGPQRVRDLLPVEAPALLERRVAFYNVWKPLYRRVEELPLVMCDPYDSETDGRARCMDHSAFEDPTSLPDAPRRESIEVRAMAFF